MKRHILLIAFILLCKNLESQTNNFVLSKEFLTKINLQYPVHGNIWFYGYLEKNPIISYLDSNRNRMLFIYNELTKIAKPYPHSNEDENNTVRLRIFDNKIFAVGYFNLPARFKSTPIEKIPSDTFEYQDFWLEFQNKRIKIDSFPYYYLDKYISCNFSDDGKMLICNPFTNVSDGYSQETDDRIYIYDLSKVFDQKIDKETISCDMCLNTFLVHNMFYFNKEIPIGHGYDGYYRNIYRSPRNNINDTVLIAHNIELISVSPNGEKILGGKYLYGKYVPVIIDVNDGKFQYILGREYPTDNAFYSYKKEKFAFIVNDDIVYIEYPDDYPFNALENTGLKYRKKLKDNSFWDRFKHPPLN